MRDANVTRCDGRRLLAALEASAQWLEGHRASVDALNVFPVPDGDTGTNMSMTLNAALREAQSSPAHDAASIAERAAYGALMGARGNSGVILSQLLRGFARAVKDRRHIEPADLAAALVEAAETASRAVMKPVEGTILTVASAAAVAARAALADPGADVPVVLAATLDEARAAVARTPSQMRVLKEAGVVDAGAQGYMLIVEGAVRHLGGQPTSVDPDRSAHEAAHVAQVAHADDYGYCTEFVVVGRDLDVVRVRDRIAQLGDSLLVVGDEGIVRVHVHTEDPGRVLSYAAPLGRLHKVKIESMQDQHDRFVAETAIEPATVPVASAIPAGLAAPALASTMPAPAGLAGVVAVTPGEGLAHVFTSLGAGAVVRGGQTMNPSIEQLLGAVDGLPQEDVLLLPNNGNVLLAASQVRELSRKRVAIVPTRTVPQGLAALVAYSADDDLAANARAMAEAAGSVRTGEVTVAVRDAELDGLSVKAGQVLGLLDDRAVVVGPERNEVSLDLMGRMGAEDGEILTVYYGAGVTADEAQSLAQQARERYAGLEVEVVEGGQSHYPYIMSLE